MTAALIAEIVGYLVKYGPAGWSAVSEIYAGVRRLTNKGKTVPTDEELAAFVKKMQDNHADLPVPE